jgi:uncharacterized membrane protein SpoIIM required for sporulation
MDRGRAVKREPFVAAREKRWLELEKLIDALRGRKERPAALVELPRLYRQICQDLALARRRMYGRELAVKLNQLALEGRDQLYRAPERYGRRVIEFVSRSFPRMVRSEAKLFWLSAALYLVPLFSMIVIAEARPDLLYSVLDPDTVQSIEEMYDPSGKHAPGTGRASEVDVSAFGFYILNNVTIDFRIFALGILFGVGTILQLVFNGIFHGAVFGHLMHIHYDSTLFPFVVGHGSFELTAMVIAGAAGLRLGLTILSPGRRSRMRAMREIGPHCLLLLLGAGGMTTMAAFIEGFWSPSSAPAAVKFSVGAVLWTLVTVYFLFAGRRDGP